MKLNTGLATRNLREVPAAAKAAEDAGFDAIWTAEAGNDGFLPIALIAEHTRRIKRGTAVAIGFPRSPRITAYTAWDLAGMSEGRFILGLGTQVKAHIERRFGMTWEAPAAKLREMILAMRALWDTWQNGAKLNFRGEFYKLTLMSPFFNPAPIAHPEIPIYIAGVNPGHFAINIAPHFMSGMPGAQCIDPTQVGAGPKCDYDLRSRSNCFESCFILRS